LKQVLENFDKVIKLENMMEVQNARLPEKNKHIPGSLWDPAIFGEPGTKERKERFGYIDLKNHYITPSVFKIVQTCTPEISQIINGKNSFIVEDGKYVKVDDGEGETGIPFLLRTLREVDLRTFCKKDKAAEAKYIEKNKDLILINKILISPPAPIRDIDLFKGSVGKQTTELNEIYAKLIYYKNTIIGDEILDSAIINKIQLTLNSLYTYIINTNFKGKQGMFRGKIMKKTMDFTTRLVLTSSPNIKLGTIGLPYTTLICIFEPIFTHYKSTHPEIDEAIKQYLKKEEGEELNFNEYLDFIYITLSNHPESIKGELADILFKSISEVVKDETVLYKRDPVIQRNSWSAAKPIPMRVGQVCMFNSMDLVPMGGDCDGDTVEIVPLFFDESKKEAIDKLSPMKSKSKFKNILGMNSFTYSIQLDNIATIYGATRD
jgi:DNA-directed RNA polymerase beta' subunit